MTAPGEKQRMLAVVAEEIADLSATALAIQAGIAVTLAEQAATDLPPRAIRQLQEIDRLQQTLNDLGVILQALSTHHAERLDVEAFAELSNLGDLRARLRGVAGAPRPPAEPGTMTLL